MNSLNINYYDPILRFEIITVNRKSTIILSLKKPQRIFNLMFQFKYLKSKQSQLTVQDFNQQLNFTVIEVNEIKKIIINFNLKTMSQPSILCFVYLFITIHFVCSENITIANYQCTISYIHGENASAVLTQCQYPGGSTNNWNNCQLHCCPTASLLIYPNFTQSVLAICQPQESSKQSITLALIIMAIVVSLFSLIIIICLGMIFAKLLKSLYNNRVSYDPKEDEEIQWDNPQRLTTSMVFPYWFKQKMKFSHFDSNCTICLQDDSCAELICGHIYHSSCIVTWLEKSNFCPLCHKNNVKAVKVYCKQCLSKCLLIRKKLLKQNIDKIQKCDICIKSSIIQEQQNGKGSQLKIYQIDDSHENIIIADQCKNFIFEDYNSQIVQIE